MQRRCLLLTALLAATCSPGPDVDPTTGGGDTSGDATSGSTSGATTDPTTAPTTSATTSATTDGSSDETTASSTGADSFNCGTVNCAAGELCFGYFSDVCNGDEYGECRPLPEGCTTDDLCSPACATLCGHYTCPQVSFGCVFGYVCNSACDQQSSCLVADTACKAVSTDDDVAWEQSYCVPTPPRPAAPGEPCTTVGDGDWTWDTCEPGAVCVSIDADTKQGVCAPQCMLVDTPECEPCISYDDQFDGVDIYFCPPACDPLAPACGDNEVCVATGADIFVCVIDASERGGAVFGACEYANGCDPGLVCVGSENSPMCNQGRNGCCLPLCDLSAPECPADTTCQPWYPPGEAPEGLDDVGYCGAGA